MTDEPRTEYRSAHQESRRMVRSTPFKAAAVVVVALSLSCVGFLLRQDAPQTDAKAGQDGPKASPLDQHFKGWQRPDVTLLLTGEVHGYLQPCGCSRPQLGGLARRFNFMKALKDRGWPVIALDVGDVSQSSGPQALIKYRTMMEGLNLLNYGDVGIGANETKLPLFQAIGNFALNNPKPRLLCANLNGRANQFGPGVIEDFAMIGGQGGVPLIGVTSVVAPSVANVIQDPTVSFADVNRALANVIPQMVNRNPPPELLVLLLQGSLAEAKTIAQKHAQLGVVQCLTAEEEPSGRPERGGNAMIIGVGHKGRYVGVVGVNRGGPNNSLRLNYEVVAMSEAFETPAGREKENPVHALLEQYAQEVQSDNYLARFPQTRHPIQVSFPKATYVGSEACKDCHPQAYEVWQKKHYNKHMDRMESHSQAYESLVTAKRPSLRQFDGECVRCHVVGFDYQTGFRNAKTTPDLVNVGCESCHGPGSLHAAGNRKPELMALMNPFKPQPNENAQQQRARMTQLDRFCQSCHDTDNDVHWNISKWDLIKHPEPKAANPAAAKPAGQ